MTTSIYHRQLSTEGFPLVAIHGLFGSLENLGVVARQLTDVYSVYAIDLPNHGRSDHIPQTTLPILADAVITWMDSIHLERAHFLGHSLGGKVSMEIALRYPEKVAGLVVADIAPVQYTRRHQDVFDAFHAVDLNALSNRMDADQQMRPYVKELSTRSFLLKNLEKSDKGWYWRINLEGLIADYDHVIAANTRDFAAFDDPVLFIKGEHSDYILAQYREAILSIFPQASVKVISGTHHWLHAEKPDIFSGIVKRFLQSVDV